MKGVLARNESWGWEAVVCVSGGWTEGRCVSLLNERGETCSTGWSGNQIISVLFDYLM